MGRQPPQVAEDDPDRGIEVRGLTLPRPRRVAQPPPTSNLSPPTSKLPHLDDAGRPRMVDISAKADTARRAVAAASVRMKPETLALIQAGRVAKGDVLSVAQIAGVMAAKKTHELIPLCHPLLLTAIDFP